MTTSEETAYVYHARRERDEIRAERDALAESHAELIAALDRMLHRHIHSNPGDDCSLGCAKARAVLSKAQALVAEAK